MPISVSGRGFAPGTKVDVVLHSTPTDLGTVDVAPDGTFAHQVAIPAGIGGGNHEIIASGTDSSHDAISVSAPLVVDVTPPTIVSVSASPSTASPGDTITVTAHVVDDTGVQAVGLQASLNGSSGNWSFCDSYAQRTSGTAADGVWTMTCHVPATALSGDYTIYPYSEDIAGNWVNTNGGPLSAVRGTFTIVGGLSNVAPPVVQSMSAEPSAVGPGDRVTVSAHVTSDVGVKAVELQSRLQGASGNWSFCDSYATLSSGTATDGVWSITCPVPLLVLNGTYVVKPYVEDVAGDWVNTNGGPQTDVTATFAVTGGLDSVAPAVIESIDVSPPSVTSGETFTVSAHVTSSVGIKAIELQSRSVTNPNNSSFCDSYATLASGTPTDGIWSITCTVPSVVVPGDYIVTPYVEDMVGDWVNSNGGPLSPTRGYFSVAS